MSENSFLFGKKVHSDKFDWFVSSPNRVTDNRYSTLFTKEPETISWINGLDKDCVFVDIGANIGIYTLYAASIGIQRCLAVEPHYENFSILNRNIVLNGLDDKVTAYCLGLGIESRLSILNHSSCHPGMSGASLGEALNYKMKEFKPQYKQGIYELSLVDFIQSVDDLAESKVAIKCDVDGFEHRIFTDYAISRLRNRVKTVLVEVNLNIPQHLYMVKHFTELGYILDDQSWQRATSKEVKCGYGNLIFLRKQI